MSNRHRRDAALIETPAGTEGYLADDLDGVLAHVGADHRFAERTYNVTPPSVQEFYNQRIVKDGAAVWDGISTVANVFLGKVEPGTFWVVEHLIVAPALATDVGFAFIMHGGGTTPYSRRARATLDAGGAFVMFAPPVFLDANADVYVRCVQTAAAASSVVCTAQVRVVSKS